MNLSKKADAFLRKYRGWWVCMSKKNISYHRFIKRQKKRIERHRANRDPECQPAYGRYNGWES